LADLRVEVIDRLLRRFVRVQAGIRVKRPHRILQERLMIKVVTRRPAA
jgi:hypothetical protein